ncbi:MAG: hypothetical protein [Caudoviricetes sp.]|nr:MAG: hypothetical protein [Caudoviricetes sp.]
MTPVVNQWMWEQKYRPQTLKDCILPELDIKTFKGMIKEGRLPHTLLVSKSPGTGKTTIAHVLCNEIQAEVLFVNGADCTLDEIRGKITNFASTRSLSPGGKVIIIDEFDRKQLVNSQMHMRSFMEAYSHNCSVLITANNIDGIIEPLQSRCNVIEFGRATEKDRKRMMLEMIMRCLKICELENVEVPDVGKRSVAVLVKKNFPDFRSCITQLNRYGKSGIIDEGLLSQITAATQDMDSLITAMRNKKFADFRALVPNLATDYQAFITKFYERMFVEVEPKSLPLIIEAIGRNQATYDSVANLEIHITWLLTEIMLEASWK